MSTFLLSTILLLFNILLARAQDYSGSGDVSLADGINTTHPEGASIESTWPGAAVGAGAVLLGLGLLIVICRGLPSTTGRGSCADDYGCCELDKRFCSQVNNLRDLELGTCICKDCAQKRGGSNTDVDGDLGETVA